MTYALEGNEIKEAIKHHRQRSESIRAGKFRLVGNSTRMGWTDHEQVADTYESLLSRVDIEWERAYQLALKLHEAYAWGNAMLVRIHMLEALEETRRSC